MASAMSLQCIVAPLILIEQLQTRLSDQLESLDNILSDIPSEHHQIRIAVIDAIIVLRSSIHTLETERLVCHLSIHRRLTQFIRRHRHLPVIEDIDDSSDSMPQYCHLFSLATPSVARWRQQSELHTPRSKTRAY